MSNPSTATELSDRRCKTSVTAATDAEIALWSPVISNWKIEALQLSREFKFKDYCHTIAFVNAVAWIANREDHHPDLTVGYNRCVVAFSTHSVGGLSENDFVCAAKVDLLVG